MNTLSQHLHWYWFRERLTGSGVFVCSLNAAKYFLYISQSNLMEMSFEISCLEYTPPHQSQLRTRITCIRKYYTTLTTAGMEKHTPRSERIYITRSYSDYTFYAREYYNTTKHKYSLCSGNSSQPESLF